ncbi:sulfotransferase domain-containing protein [Nocardioides marinus]|uniref:Sulfotransferase domain-containing protein n=1 Tax=Nocardioides marinus TaxID=374514 RepID=A0A7Y9YJF6_9ACTN|nr:hypothetical protein [Nocardioides marinus]
MPVRTLTHTLAHRLPETATESMRHAALAAGRATAPARRLPSFLVIGAQRCGTTTLFRLLAEHPHLLRPTVSKGTGYFDDGYHHSSHWYRGHFALRTWGGALRAGPVHSFEASGYYLFHPLAAERIARDLPHVHVVALVRDPVERARSAHRHEQVRGFETLDFDSAVRAEAVRTHGEEQRLREDPTYRSFAHRHHAYLQRGEYARQLDRFVAALGRDRVHVVDYGRFFADPVDRFVDLQRALGVPVWRPDHVRRWNAADKPPLDDERRRALLLHFEPHDEALTDLLGEEPSWRSEAGR